MQEKMVVVAKLIFLDLRHPLFPSTFAQIIFAIHKADRNHIWFTLLFILSVVSACNQPNFHFRSFIHKSSLRRNAEKQLLIRNGLSFMFQIKNAQMIILTKRNHFPSQPAQRKNPEENANKEVVNIYLC